MDNKNETQRQNIIWIVQILLLLMLCFLMFLQNKKLERLMLLSMRRNYDPYEIHFCDKRPNNDFILMEKSMNRRFMEFAREIDEMRYIVDNMFDNNTTHNNYEDLERLQQRRKVEKSKVKNKSHKNTVVGNENKENKIKHSNKKTHQFNLKTKYEKTDKEYKVELDLPDGFTLDDVDISLENSILTLNVQKEQTEGKDGDIRVYDSFYQSFTIPKTKSKTKDIDKKLDDSKLKIKVPIK